MKTVDHEDWINQKLQNPEFAAEYLNAASEEDDPRIYLTALRQIVQARGGIKEIAKKPAIKRNLIPHLIVPWKPHD